MAKKQTPGKEAKFLAALEQGRTISRRQAMAQFRLGNPSATVLRIQEDGSHGQIQRQYTPTKIKVAGRTYVANTVKYSLKQD